MFSRTVALSLCLVMCVATVAFGERPATRLIEPEWLAANLDGEDIRILDVRKDIMDYWRGHIPGAVYLDPGMLRLADHGIPGKLMPPALLAEMLGRLGVTNETGVVVYAEGNEMDATYVVWALDYLGHESVALLDGGFARWQKQERTVTQEYPQIAPTEYPLPAQLGEEVRATLEDVRSAVMEGLAVLVDVRPMPMYTGEAGVWQRNGHIRGAVQHVGKSDLSEDGAWKDEAELAEAYERLGVTPDKTVIAYCGMGLGSSQVYFTLKHILNYPDVRNYDGSLSEWSSIDELPMTTGPNP